MKILNRKGDTDPVTQGVATTGAYGEKVLLTPFTSKHNASDDVEGFGDGQQTPAEAPQGRLKIVIPLINRTVVIK